MINKYLFCLFLDEIQIYLSLCQKIMYVLLFNDMQEENPSINDRSRSRASKSCVARAWMTLQEGVLCFAVWATDFRDDTNGGLARLDTTGHGAQTPGGSNPSTPGATPTTPSGGFSTTQPRNRNNATHRPDIRKGTFR